MLTSSDFIRILLFGIVASIGALCGEITTELFPRFPNALVFMAIWNAAIAAGITASIVICETVSLKKVLPSAVTMSKAIAGGILVGGLAGFLVQLFFTLSLALGGVNVAENPSSIFAAQVIQICAWSILGGLTAAGAAWFLPNLPAKRGLLGGLIGGATGGLVFVLVGNSLIQHFHQSVSMWIIDVLCRIVGVPFIGLGIGVMIAFVDTVLRESWLEIRYAKNEVRRVSLGSHPIILGGDRDQCTVVIPNCPDVAAIYRLELGKLTIDDRLRNQIQAISPGDSRSFVGATVTVCGKVVPKTSSTSPAIPSASTVGFDLLIGKNRWPLRLGVSLTKSNLEGSVSRHGEAYVAEVVAHPNQPEVLGLKNLTKGQWTAQTAAGEVKVVEFGKSAKLADRTVIDFGTVRGEIRAV